MSDIEQIPQLRRSIAVLGSSAEELCGFIQNRGLEYIIGSDAGAAVIAGENPQPEGFDSAAVPYGRYSGKDLSGIKKCMTYALDDNGADVVAKNVRISSGFVSFELLSPDGIGRIYIKGNDKAAANQALALACGLMLVGLPAEKVIALVSDK